MNQHAAPAADRPQPPQQRPQAFETMIEAIAAAEAALREEEAR